MLMIIILSLTYTHSCLHPKYAFFILIKLFCSRIYWGIWWFTFDQINIWPKWLDQVRMCNTVKLGWPNLSTWDQVYKWPSSIFKGLRKGPYQGYCSDQVRSPKLPKLKSPSKWMWYYGGPKDIWLSTLVTEFRASVCGIIVDPRRAHVFIWYNGILSLVDRCFTRDMGMGSYVMGSNP